MKFLVIFFVISTLCSCRNKDLKIVEATNGNSTLLLYENFIMSSFKLDLDTLNNTYLHINRNDSILLSEIIKEKNHFIIYVDVNSCYECINNQFYLLSQTKLAINDYPIFVITNNVNYRPIYSIMRKFGLKYSLFYTNYQDIFNEKIIGPIYFIMSSDLVVNKSFNGMNWRDTSLLLRYYKSIEDILHFNH
jgi:hypothetical protein